MYLRQVVVAGGRSVDYSSLVKAEKFRISTFKQKKTDKTSEIVLMLTIYSSKDSSLERELVALCSLQITERERERLFHHLGQN